MPIRFLLFTLILLLTKSTIGQFIIPFTKSELKQYYAQKDSLSHENIDIAKVWLYNVNGNKVSSSRILTSEIIYDNNGLPKKIINYDEKQNIKSFTYIKYNNQLLPFEEVKFNADSILLGGVMYEYKDSLVFRQVGYEYSKIKYINTYMMRNNNMVIISSNDNNDVIYRSLVDFCDIGGDHNFIISMIKIGISNDNFEKIIVEQDKFLSLTKKYIYDDKDNGILKKVFYDNNGKVIKMITYDINNNEIQNSSFEYNERGSVSRVIEYSEIQKQTSVYVINYFSKTKKD